MASGQRLRLVRGGGGPPGDFNIQFGIKTSSGYGEYPVGEVAGSTVIDNDTGLTSTDWVINSRGNICPAGTYGVHKTFAKTAGQTYSLTLASGATCTITLVANTYHVASVPGDGSTTWQPRILSARADNVAGSFKLGDTVICRATTAWFTPANNIRFNLQPPVAGYGGAGTITGGSGYVNGTYQDVPLTTTTGSGTGAVARITVASGAVRNVHINKPGTGYVAGDIVSASNVNLGGSGSGFSMVVINLGGMITFRSEVIDNTTIDSTGNPRRGGNANLVAVGVNADVIGNSRLPFRFEYLDFTCNIDVEHFLGISYTSSVNVAGYGAEVYRCHFENDVSIVAQTRRRQTALAQWRGGRVEECRFIGMDRPHAGGIPDATIIDYIWGNTFSDVTGDTIQFRQDVVGIDVRDNFAFNWIYTTSEHPDFMQHLGMKGITAGGSGYTSGTHTNIELAGGGYTGIFATIGVQAGVVTNINTTNNGDLPLGVEVPGITLVDPNAIGPGSGFSWTAPGTHPNLGTIKHNICVRNISSAGKIDAQGYFFADSIGKAVVEDCVIEENLYLGTLPNGVQLTCFGDPTVQRNTIIADFNAANYSSAEGNSLDTQIWWAECSGGIRANNITNAFQDTLQRSAPTDATNNTLLTRDLTSYNTIFDTYVDTPITTREAAMAALAPAIGVAAASGGAMNTDGTYRGALFPPDTDGSVRWNNGSVYVQL